jgi:hypothetical protein
VRFYEEERRKKKSVLSPLILLISLPWPPSHLCLLLEGNTFIIQWKIVHFLPIEVSLMAKKKKKYQEILPYGDDEGKGKWSYHSPTFGQNRVDSLLDVTESLF